MSALKPAPSSVQTARDSGDAALLVLKENGDLVDHVLELLPEVEGAVVGIDLNLVPGGHLGERLHDVVERLDRVQVEPGLVEALLVERDVLVHVNDGLLYPGELDLAGLLARRVKNVAVVARWAPPPPGNTM